MSAIITGIKWIIVFSPMGFALWAVIVSAEAFDKIQFVLTH